MSIYTDSYQTVIGSAFVTKNIVTAIKKLLIAGVTESLDVETTGKFKPIFITGSHSDEDEIPVFTHPITIINFKDDNYLCTDLRPFLRKPESGKYDVESRIRNRTEYNFAKSRAILNLIWLNRDVSTLKINLSFAGIVFSSWLSDIVSKTYALDFKDQTLLAIITSFYYQSMFSNETEFDEDAKRRMAVHTINATKAPAELVFQVFDKIETMETIEDYCATVVRILENVRLEHFNHAALLTISRNSWFGTNARDFIAICLEHPPTWMAIVYTAISERTFKNSMIYRIAEKAGKRGGAEEFIRNYVALVREHTKVEVETPNYKYFE
jgi:hypothetical protein